MTTDAHRAERVDGAATDAELAAALATEAGELLLAVRRELAGADPAQLRAAGDHRSHDLLAKRLRVLRPDDALLSEEGPAESGHHPARLDAARVWIVDPLDGTREFGELDRDDWAVHVALWADGALAAGAVALPAQGVTLSSARPPPRPTDPPERPRVVVSRTRAPALVEQVAAAIGGELVAMGSAGAKVAAVVAGRAEVYLHAGGQYEWDSAGPVAVAVAAGLHASRIDGSRLLYNQADPLLPDLLVCRPELAAAVLAAVAAG